MRSKLTALVLCLMMLALLMCLRGAQAESSPDSSAPQPPAPVGNDEQGNDDDGDDDNGGFGKRLAGTFVENGSIGGGDFTGLQTLGADGTQYGNNTNCCGIGEPEANGPQGNSQGVWTRTGPRQVTLTAIIFVFNPDGSLAVTARPTVVLDFDHDLQFADGVITTDIFLPGQDPTDPDEVPIVTFEGTTSYSRLDQELLGLI